MLQDQFDFFHPEYRAKNIDLIVSNEKRETIFNDHEKLSAVLSNLLKNALKYTRKGEVEFGYLPEGDYIRFYVRDTGIGVSQQNLPYIFRRFAQTGSVLTKPYDGAGLGLSISKAYVEMMGGRIWAESRVDHGSVFQFTIPVQPSGSVK